MPSPPLTIRTEDDPLLDAMSTVMARGSSDDGEDGGELEGKRNRVGLDPTLQPPSLVVVSWGSGSPHTNERFENTHVTLARMQDDVITRDAITKRSHRYSKSISRHMSVFEGSFFFTFDHDTLHSRNEVAIVTEKRATTRTP
jgi:hypothetical protein